MKPNARPLILVAIALAGCNSGWSAPRETPGPLPLSPSNAPITRLVKTKTTFEVTLKEVLWDEGNGPVPMDERVQPLIDAVPQELLDRLHSTRELPSPDGKARFAPLFRAWGIVVSLNPDVLIITVCEHAKGSKDWVDLISRRERAHYIHERLEWMGWRGPGDPAGRTGYELALHAGSLVPWSDEMYVVSTDPKVEYRRLKFENNQTTILLPVGKLILSHHDDDVDVSRE
jgi:hypothetical protein